MSHTTRFAKAFAALAMLGGVGTGVALAAGVTLPFSADGNTINGCYSSGGTMKVLTPAQTACPDGFTAIRWNVSGPQGAQGPQGPQGPPGPAGSSGDVYTTHGARGVPSGNTDTIAFLTLPPGAYMLSAAIVGTPSDPSNRAISRCWFSGSASPTFSPLESSVSTGGSRASYPDNGSVFSEPIPGVSTMALVGAVTVVDGDVGVDCAAFPHDVSFDATLTATAVGAIHDQVH